MSVNKKRVSVILVVLIILFLISCKQQQIEDNGTTYKSAIKGTKGIELKFLNDAPPKQILDTQPLVAILEVSNLGATDISGANCMVHLRGYDKTLIPLESTRSCGTLAGIKRSDSIVEFDYLQFESQVHLGQYPSYSFDLAAFVCYNYETNADFDVCIDPNPQMSNGLKACTVKNPSTSGGQGAPVSISSIKQTMLGDHVTFEIDISDTGTGQVFALHSGLGNCPDNILIQNKNIVNYQVNLGGNARLIKCSPSNQLLLRNKKAKVSCTFSVPKGPTYKTKLDVKLRYNYLNTESTSVEVISINN